MPFEDSSSFSLLLLVAFICIFYPTNSNSYSFSEMPHIESFNPALEIPGFSPPGANTLPSQTIMPSNYPGSGLPPIRNLGSGTPARSAANQGQRLRGYHNATRTNPYPWPSLPFPDLGNRVPTSWQTGYATYGSAQNGTYRYPGDQQAGTDPSTSPNQSPSEYNHAPAPLISWLLGISICGLMGFSRKPC